MSSDTDRSSEREIAYVLYMDVVGYSRLHLNEQAACRRDLQLLVRSSAEFRRAEGRGQLICSPSGDGMALVFLRDPEEPVQCALEIARALSDYPQIQLRMGVHAGPVLRVEEINASTGLSGAGINFAQRVMACGDAGHILLSSAAVELLGQLGDWSGALHDLGDCEVKHGVRLHLYNLCTEEVGNKARPQRLAVASPDSSEPAQKSAEGRAESAERRTSQRVALLYKRNAQPDEQVLKLLEQQLKANGYEVFIDRHLTIGVEWAKEIERQVRTADAVVPLLSQASIHSEMLAYEVQIAHEASQQEPGKPRLLPVRINYTGPLPETLAVILGPLHYTLWESHADDDRLVAELLDALRNPPKTRTGVPPGKLDPVGGAVPLDSQFYIWRPTDDEFRDAIARRDSIVLVKGARQMGKTSLLARGLQHARESGARVVLTDFQTLNADHLESAEALFRALAEWIADQLDLDVLPEEVWDARRGASINFQRYLRREVLGKFEEPLAWGLDEVDRLFTCDFGSEVFGLFRSWHNARSLDPTAPWSRLTLAIAYATEAHLFITDMNQSPFNVGTRLALEDFTFDQVADLNRRYGQPLRDDAEVARYFRLVGGHPYLAGRGLREMITHDLDIAAFEAQAARDEGVFGDHLRRMLVLLVKDPELCDVVRGVLRGRPCPSPDSFFRLRTAGILAGESSRDARPRCQLYTTYLERHLLG
jgi:class 3 adenylate cyclase